MRKKPTFLAGRDFCTLGVLGYGRTSLKILSNSRTRCSSTARSARRRLARSSDCKYYNMFKGKWLKNAVEEKMIKIKLKRKRS